MDLRALAMGVAFALMWSSAFTSARIIVAAAPPLGALTLRFALSGLVAVAIARALGQSWRLNRAEWRAVAIFGVCQNALYLGFYFVAMQTVPASLAAIIASIIPLLTAAAGRAVGSERLGRLGALGLAAGIVGVVLILGLRVVGGADLWGLALCFVGVVALALATLTVRGTGSADNVLMVVGLQMLVGSAALLGPALLEAGVAVALSWTLVAAFLYTTLVPGLLATYVWFHLVRRVGPTRAAVFHFLNPVFGVAIAAVILGEPLLASDALGVALVAAGILAVQRARMPGAPAGPAR